MDKIPEEIIDEIKNRIDIVELINEYVPLKKQGRNYVGLCPFHIEKSPSFSVSHEKQMFYCFGCGKGGNVFTFLKEKDNLSFPETVTALASRAGITLPSRDRSPQEQAKYETRQRLFNINELAMEFYHYLLQKPDGSIALNYLIKRGLSSETISKFKIGYAPNSWTSLLDLMTKRGYKQQELLELGLVSKNNKDKYYDRFRNRVIFPIFDFQGRVIGFGGRVLDDSQPKYLNSPETPLFNKGSNLYAINFAKGSIREEDEAIIVEGYMDAICCHQYGITNTVASLGTALTPEQGKLLMRNTYNMTIAYDADTAGANATLRGIGILHDLGCRVNVVELGESKDPDEYLLKNGTHSFRQLIKQSLPYIEYKLKILIEEINDSTIEGKQKIVQALSEDLRQAKSPILQQSYVELIAKKIGLSEAVIWAELKRKSVSSDRNIIESNNNIRKDKPLTALDKAEKELLVLILENKEIINKVVSSGGKDLFYLEDVREAFSVAENLANNNRLDTVNLLNILPENTSSWISKMLFVLEQRPNKSKLVEDYLKLLKQRYIDKQLYLLQERVTQLEKDGDLNEVFKIVPEIQRLTQAKHSL